MTASLIDEGLDLLDKARNIEDLRTSLLAQLKVIELLLVLIE